MPHLPLMRPMCWRLIAYGALLAAFALPTAAAELSYAHFAPGAGEVRLQIPGEAEQVLTYREMTATMPAADGERAVRVLHADGRELASATLTLTAADRFVVILAGNGSADAPYQLRVAVDHNHPLLSGVASMQDANLAVTAPGALRMTLSCGSVIPSETGPLPFGYGTATPDAPYDGSSGVSLSPASRSCVDAVRVQGANVSAPGVARNASPGDRQRRFAIGDGTQEPYEMLLVTQQREATLPSIAPNALIEGIWYPAENPGIGLELAFDPEATSGRQVSGVFFGFRGDGEPVWVTLERDRPGSRYDILEYAGGTPDGTRAVVGQWRGSADLIVHSCSEITLVPAIVVWELQDTFPRFPRNAIRMSKLFPPGCSTLASTRSEDAP